jgi:hypothetical protein
MLAFPGVGKVTKRRAHPRLGCLLCVTTAALSFPLRSLDTIIVTKSNPARVLPAN